MGATNNLLAPISPLIGAPVAFNTIVLSFCNVSPAPAPIATELRPCLSFPAPLPIATLPVPCLASPALVPTATQLVP